jgi:hypothetical protein
MASETQAHISRFEFLAMAAVEADRAKKKDDVLLYAGALLVLKFARELLFMDDNEARATLTDLITHT